MTSIVARHDAQTSGNGTFSPTLVGTGVNRLIIVEAETTAGGTQTLTDLKLNGVSGTQIASNRPTNETQHGNVSIYVFTDAQLPGAGVFTFTPTWTASVDSAYIIRELQDAPQIPPYITGFSSPIAIPNVATATVTATLSGAEGLLGIFTVCLASSSATIPSASNPSASLENPVDTLEGNHRSWLRSYEDVIVASASEVYSADINLNRVSSNSDNIFAYTYAINPIPPNQPPVADDDTFTIFDTIQNGETIGTYTATDSDGTVVSYSIDNPVLAIDNSGVITMADNSGVTVGVDITATVTATDNEGATDTGLITITVIEPFPTILSVTPIRLGEQFTITVDSAVDLTTRSVIRAYIGGVSCGNPNNINTSTVTFNAPIEMLDLSINHNLVLKVSND